jgi:hypothetical protein
MQTKNYIHAEQAARACAAIYLLDAAVELLERVPSLGVGQCARLLKLQRNLKTEGRRALKIMDAEHTKAGVPRNEC